MNGAPSLSMVCRDAIEASSRAAFSRARITDPRAPRAERSYSMDATSQTFARPTAGSPPESLHANDPVVCSQYRN